MSHPDLVMRDYQDVRKAILNKADALGELTQLVHSLTGEEGAHNGQWKKTVERVQTLLRSETLRVAVIGPIKSGKSTFVNAFLQSDHLKRGAGVITSIVTRIRPGKTPTATLYFKSWDDINTEIRHACVIFPDSTWRQRQELFDLRRSEDRTDLKKALEALSTDQLITQSGRNADSVLLFSYLAGYDRVKDYISADGETHTFSADDFTDHRQFSGSDNLSVYLKDILLTVDAATLTEYMEVADCQGSDSTNPRHLAMIQDYLMVTHLIVYVISSRTGLRQADIRFLAMIKKMGIMDNILFVINFDFGEHPDLADLKRLLERIKSDLALIKADAKIYSFSALFKLFQSIEEALPEKEKARFELWKQENEMAVFSEEAARDFNKAFYRRLTEERYPLLLANHIGRLDLVADGIGNWSKMQQDLLQSDKSKIDAIRAGIQKERAKIDNLSSMIRSTLNGAVEAIKQDVRTVVDRFFDASAGEVLPETIDFISRYSLSESEFDTDIDSAFSAALYHQFEAFKQGLDRHMTEAVNPKVMRFLKEQEALLLDRLTTISAPYDAMVQEVYEAYNEMLAEHDLTPLNGQREPQSLQIETIQSVSGIRPPAASVVMNYTAKIRGESLARFGAYSLGDWFRKVFRKKETDPLKKRRKALQHGLARMKKETEQSMRSHFVDFRETVKFQYLFKLIDAAANMVHEQLMAQFDAHQSDLGAISDLMRDQRLDRKSTLEELDKFEFQAQHLSEQLNKIKMQLTEMAKPPISS